MADNAIRITGAKEFRTKIARVRDALPATVRDALAKAGDIWISDARPRIPRRTGRAAASLHVKTELHQLRVEAGGPRAPYFGWLDFGGNRRGRGGGIARRPYRSSGRYILLSYRRKRGEILDAMQGAVLDSARHAGLEVTRG